MPRRRNVWASWNYLSRVADDGDRAVSVTYWMNRLQGLDTDRDYLVSLNPLTPPDPAKVIAEMTYDHPVFDQAAMDAQRELHGLQGIDGVWYCGSYFGYGFHEDALRAAVETAGRLGAETGWLTGRDEDEASLPVSEGIPALEPAT
jgi:predicted NAD/FAD-binding protein